MGLIVKRYFTMSYHAWVTRDETPGGPLCRALVGVGVEPICEPVVGRRACADVSEELRRLGRDVWLVLTSGFAIGCVDGELASMPRVAVVGEKSAAAARARGFRVELVSPGKGASALFEALREVAVGKRVLYPRSSEAALTPPNQESVVDCFGEFISPILYETYYRDFDIGVVDRVDCVTFASPSAVRGVDKKISIAGIGLPIASIGPTTSAEVLRLGGVVAGEADEPGFVGLARVVAEMGGK